jgi:hypothetical protein
VSGGDEIKSSKFSSGSSDESDGIAGSGVLETVDMEFLRLSGGWGRGEAMRDGERKRKREGREGF